MIPGRGFPVPPPQWYGQIPGGAAGRPNVTNIMIWALGGAQILQIQWFGHLERAGAFLGPGALIVAPGCSRRAPVALTFVFIVFHLVLQ